MRRLALVVAVLGAVLLPSPADAALNFRPCGEDGFQCARLTVPLDYGDPNGPTVKVAVARRPANDRRRRIGPLMINYGGPGGGAIATTQAIGAQLFAPYLDRFDLVAIDPRGTGFSRPSLNCDVNQERLGIYHQPFVRPPGGDQRELVRARTYARRCERRNRKIAAHLSTANVARDMDRVRRALGDDEVSYFGFSYGTFLGATYAALFPDRVRVAVLDGAVDPTAYIANPSSGLAQQSAAFERSLDRYLNACRGERRYCRWTRGSAPQAAYDKLIRRANRKPIPARNRTITGGRTVPVSGDDINFAITGELYGKQLWPEITRALGGAVRGDASLMRLLVDSSYGRRSAGDFGPSLDRYFMIGASEQQYPTDPQTVFDAEPGNLAAFPHFFFNTGQAQLPYTAFTERDTDVFAGPFTLGESGPTPLVIGTTFDPATPYGDARRLVDSLGRGRLLTMRGDGHTAYGFNSPCINRAVDRYVIRRTLPPPEKTCRQRVPFPPRPLASAATAGAPDGVPVTAPEARLAAPF